MRSEATTHERSGKLIRALLLGTLLSLLLAACGGGSGGGGSGGGGGVDLGVKVMPDSVNLEVGETQSLSALVNEGEGDQAVDWTSSDPSVASVNPAGLVTGVAAGNAVITAVSQADTSLSGTATVEVEAPACKTPVTIDADIIAATTLERLDHALGCTDYLVTFMRQVRQPLVIKAGVTIEFDMGAGFFVAALDGSLTGTGTSAQPIVLKRKPGAALPWSGLVFGTDDAANRLEHVRISGTGAPVTDAVYPYALKASVIVPNGYQANIVSSEFAGGDGYGIWLAPGAQLPEFSGNSFAGLGAAPIALDPSQLQYLDGSNTLKGPVDNPNASEVIELLARDLVMTSATVKDLGLPYLLSGEFSADADYVITGGSLTVEAGVELLFAAGSGLEVQDNGASITGTLTVQGTAEAPVIMRPATETDNTSFWKGVVILSTGSNAIEHADIGFGGGRTDLSIPANDGGNVIVVGPGILEINNTHLHDAPMCLERIDTGGTPPVVTGGAGMSTDACSATDLP